MSRIRKAADHVLCLFKLFFSHNSEINGMSLITDNLTETHHLLSLSRPFSLPSFSKT